LWFEVNATSVHTRPHVLHEPAITWDQREDR
jgi:hypothetical protein